MDVFFVENFQGNSGNFLIISLFHISIFHSIFPIFFYLNCTRLLECLFLDKRLSAPSKIVFVFFFFCKRLLCAPTNIVQHSSPFQASFSIVLYFGFSAENQLCAPSNIVQGCLPFKWIFLIFCILFFLQGSRSNIVQGCLPSFAVRSSRGLHSCTCTKLLQLFLSLLLHRLSLCIVPFSAPPLVFVFVFVFVCSLSPFILLTAATVLLHHSSFFWESIFFLICICIYA